MQAALPVLMLKHQTFEHTHILARTYACCVPSYRAQIQTNTLARVFLHTVCPRTLCALMLDAHTHTHSHTHTHTNSCTWQRLLYAFISGAHINQHTCRRVITHKMCALVSGTLIKHETNEAHLQIWSAFCLGHVV